MAEPMEVDLLAGLQQHLTMERQSHNSYLALALWCAEREMRGFASLFKQEAIDEQHHAALFADYLLARGQRVELDALPAPCQNWADLEHILVNVFQMEADVTTSLQQLYSQAERSGDVRTTVFLDPIIQGQISSEHQAAHLLGRVRFAAGNPAALLVIDGELSAGQIAPVTMA
jgi:ferritin